MISQDFEQESRRRSICVFTYVVVFVEREMEMERKCKVRRCTYFLNGADFFLSFLLFFGIFFFVFFFFSFSFTVALFEEFFGVGKAESKKSGKNHGAWRMGSDDQSQYFSIVFFEYTQRRTCHLLRTTHLQHQL